MTNRAARRSQTKTRRKQATQARAQIRHAITKGSVIPAPPEPAWAHWYNPILEEWFAHDDRVIETIKAIQADA